VVNGIKVAKRVRMNWGGLKFAELEFLQVRFPDKFDASVFARP
jgi:hypothetical protein